MKRMTVGVRLESLGLPLRKGLAEASRMGARGVQLDASGDLGPDQLSQTGRRELKNLLRAYDLELTALGCPLRRSLDTAEDQDARLEYVRKVMTLAAREFMRRFLLHAVPDGFHRIRHVGFLANGHRTTKLARCRALLAAPTPEP